MCLPRNTYFRGKAVVSYNALRLQEEEPDVCIHACVCGMYIYVYTCMCVCIYMCIYMCMLRRNLYQVYACTYAVQQ